MRQVLFFAILMLTIAALPAHSQIPQFQNDAATEAVEEYLRTIGEARRECLARLAIAEAQALKDGDREDAEKIQSARATVDNHRPGDVFDPFDALEQQIVSTKWANADNMRNWSSFDKGHQLRNSKGTAGNWAVVSDNTVASTTGVRYVYLWVFDKDAQSVTLQRFNHDKSYSRPYVKQ